MHSSDQAETAAEMFGLLLRHFRERAGLSQEQLGKRIGYSSPTEFATAWMSKAGVTLASIWTGGDPGHAPARRTYEKAGYTALPLVRYYKAL
ncbi:hypothetical protein SCYAM73S_01338 [Streptomyces cyaneofuscatus]